MQWTDTGGSPLVTDLYELTMLQTYLEGGMTETAVFEFFVRELPPERGFLLAAGLAQAVDFLEGMRFSDEELSWMRGSGLFSDTLLEYLRSFRFTGELYAMPEGTVAFADEPLLRVVAPLPEAQLVESRLMNLVNFQTLIASKAARFVLAAPGKSFVDFGLRRTHGAEAGLLAARAAYLAGFAGTATVAAGACFDIPLFGTMAHSFIQAHDSEVSALEDFARSHRENVTLLIDTYDTARGARRVAELAGRLSADGIEIGAVRLDSGDLLGLAREVRRLLDAAGLQHVRILCSGGLDEHAIEQMEAAGTPAAGYGVGSALGVSADAPSMDSAYKLQEYAGTARRKQSAGKATWPGRKQVFRNYGTDDLIVSDALCLEHERWEGRPLLERVMSDGRREEGVDLSLASARARAARELQTLTPAMRRLRRPQPLQPRVSEAVRSLAAEVDRRID